MILLKSITLSIFVRSAHKKINVILIVRVYFIKTIFIVDINDSVTFLIF